MHKDKHPFHFLEGIARALTFGTIGNDLVHVVDLIKNLPLKKNWKKVWEFNKVFQDVWAIKLPWVEVVIGPNGKMTQVKYIICNQVEKRNKLLIFKLDGLRKHVGCCKATFAQLGVVVDEYYMSLFSQHVKNE